ncbi:MAG: patatin-like phospholipase family protein [Caldilineaceae bacterium]
MIPTLLATAVLLLHLLIFAGILWRQRPFPWSHLVQYLYLIRYSLLTEVALLLTGALALGALNSTLGNFFVLTTWWSVALATWFAILVAWVAMTTIRLTLRSAPSFLALKPLPEPNWPEWLFALIFSLAALPTLYAIWVQSPGEPLVLLSGMGVGVAVAWLLRAVAIWLKEPIGRGLGFLRLDRISRRLLQAADYQEIEKHQSATSFLVLALLLYGAGFWLLMPNQPWSLTAPAILYLHLLLILFGWLLPGLALFFDRFRIPLSLVLVGIAVAFGILANTDHFFVLREKPIVAAGAPLPPADVLENRLEQRAAPTCSVLTVVTASGGGIRASLWTAKVLTELQREIGRSFSDSVALISAVSGGSVGTMYFVDAFTPDGPPTAEQLDQIVAAAGHPSLAPTVWGLIYPDLWRLFFAFPGWDRTRDRGWALEEAWKTQMSDPEATLGKWRQGVIGGWRPAVIFNTTLVETGEHFLFTTLDGLDGGPTTPTRWATRHFSGVYRPYDVDVATAARLSATFPYVSPIARAMYNRKPVTPTYHFADGGYYDNNGVAAVVEWLEAVNPTSTTRALLPQRSNNVLIIQIRASDAQPGQALTGEQERGGWLYTLAGPMITLLNVNSTTQVTRGDVELRLLERAYAGVIGKQASFQLTSDGVLSWQLSDHQRDQILNGWDSQVNQTQLAAVKQFFAENGCSGQ